MPDTSKTTASSAPEVAPSPQAASVRRAAGSRNDGDEDSSTNESTLVVADEKAMIGLLGSRDILLRQLEENLAADIHVRGNRITLRGAAADVAFAERVLRELLTLQDSGTMITPDAVRRAIGMLAAGGGNDESPSEVLGLNIVSRRGRTIRPKTVNQKRYVDAIDANTIVFGIGPAGTGKTYLAVAMGVALLKQRRVERIILSRPAVEAGERLGFLPGDLKEKVDPYMRPLYDALQDMLPEGKLQQRLETGQIEISPLAYMRGRTLSNAYVILDEAQNSTPSQMKMFLTRLGENSRMVITGDPTQSDLPPGVPSGLGDAVEKLRTLKAVSVVQFEKKDVVRHPLVGEIIEAYETAARPVAQTTEEALRLPVREPAAASNGQRQ